MSGVAPLRACRLHLRVRRRTARSLPTFGAPRAPSPFRGTAGEPPDGRRALPLRRIRTGDSIGWYAARLPVPTDNDHGSRLWCVWLDDADHSTGGRRGGGRLIGACTEPQGHYENSAESTEHLGPRHWIGRSSLSSKSVCVRLTEGASAAGSHAGARTNLLSAASHRGAAPERSSGLSGPSAACAG